MKYQVYLNKETSKAIERIATIEGVKPNTLIKSIIEGLISKASEAALSMTKGIFSKSAKGGKDEK